MQGISERGSTASPKQLSESRVEAISDSVFAAKTINITTTGRAGGA